MRIYLFILVVFLNCESKSNSDNFQNKLQLIQILTSKSSSNSITCSDSAPSFSSLQKLMNTKYSTCHPSENSVIDPSSYTSIKSKVVSGNPYASTLYGAVSTGKMSSSAYTTIEITSAIYCWIKGGANQ